MRHSDSHKFVTAFYGFICLAALILWLGVWLGQWFWWLCGLLVICVLSNGPIEARRKRLEPCIHGTAGANQNRNLCEHCKIEDDRIWKADMERRQAEREKAYQRHLVNIRLPSYLKEMDPFEFEKLACDIHAKMGYEVETTPDSGDNGADGFLRKNGDLTILQAKRVKGSVGEPILRDLFGTMHSFGANYGVVVTTGKVSKQARLWIENKPIRIIELEELSTIIRQVYPDEGEIVPDKYAISDVHTDLCPLCHRYLNKKNGSYGKFLGCSGYPSCKYTRSLKRK